MQIPQIYKHRFIIFAMMIARVLGSNTIKFTNVIRNNIILHKQMPSIYIDRDFQVSENLKKSIYSIEHIFPRSHLDKKDHNDMHNIVRTINELNTQRSNYRYHEEICPNDENWIKLKFDNYVNHKNKLFVPNSASRGFISRSILYMSKEYDYNPSDVIDVDVLINWYYTYPPTKEERFHNEFIKKFQNRNNDFISKYGKKSKAIKSYLEKLL